MRRLGVSGNSKNVAYGPITGHLYKSPGNYNVGAILH